MGTHKNFFRIFLTLQSWSMLNTRIHFEENIILELPKIFFISKQLFNKFIAKMNSRIIFILRLIKAKLTLDLTGRFWSSGDHQMSSNPVDEVSGNIPNDALNKVDDEKCARHNTDYDLVDKA